MRKLFTLLFVLTFAAISVNAQTEKAKQKIIEQTNVEYLQNFAQEANMRFETNKQKALEMALQKGWVIREDKDGKLRELIGVTDKGTPVYYETYNVDAANSTRANTLHNGGSLGLNIEGQGMTAHVWDGGLARTTHQEYDGPGGSNRFSIGDGTSTMHYHAAHVTGTIMASGVDPDAKGMAPQSYVVGYEWSNDVSEATTAAAGGMLVSNHSYGYGADAIPDAWFGQYGQDAVDWDGLMYNAPYYLMLVAAGNDGDDETSNAAPLDGNAAYDKLNGHATSKNNLVVANAQDAIIEGGELVSVLINTGSSEGPTDDYRIKPDIAGNGTQLYSTYETADDAYNSISGTSMATPNVTGTLLLLQQHYNDLNATFMRAATLKGLALHTADDAGATGPDAVFGWGLMNGKAAAEAITNNGLESIIEERTLTNGGSYSFDVVANGIDDLVASISWTDPAGTLNSGTNSSTPALVNDLDVRITEGASTFYPYRLTSITTNGTGDNTVDPYEKIIIDNAVCGTTYTITINHKGTLSASQDYSIIVTGIKEASVDAGIVDVSPSVSSCEYSNNTPIDITVANQGGSTVSNIDVAYEIRKADNSLVGNGAYTIASISACNSDVHTVYGDMSENGETYNVTVSIVLAGDENSANNSYMGTFMPMNVDLTVPGSEYSTSFEAGSLAEIGWSYEDVNGDGGQAIWYIYDDAGFANTGSGFAIMFAGAGDLQSDDWMYSPCLYLKAGQTYEVSYYSMEFQDKNESIALYLGSAPNAAAMTTTIEAAYDPATSWTQRTPGSFTVPTDGVYYLGWHSYNMTDSYAPAIDDVTITNTSPATLPQVTTSAITNIDATSADGGGDVTAGGSSAVTERGIVYSTSINPTTSDNKVAAGTAGTGVFSALTMSGLTAATTYYVRAYAINSSGTVYGANESFTTLSSMNFISATTAQDNSNIVNQGATDEDILEIQIEMDGALSPLSATSFTLSTNGSTDAANDLTSAKLYYTSTSSTFATSNQFGSAVSNPDGSFTITGTQELVDGINYFWLAYDISAGATGSNVIDAECSSITIGSARIPDVTAPAGSREIFVDPCATPVSVFPFNEGFESGAIPSCWSYEGTAWAYQAGGHDGNPVSAHTGSFNALFYHGSTVADVSKLVTPPLDLSSGTSPSLSFWHTQPLWSPDQDELRIYYKTSAGGTWTLLAEYLGDTPDWTKETIELPNPSSEYYIAFEATGAYGYGIGLDDIEILSTTPEMTYVSGTTTQLNTGDVYRGDNDVEIIGIEIVTSNTVSPLDATSFTFSTNGSSNALQDISNAKLYYTGTSGTFNNVNQFGTTEVGPNGTFTITGSQTLVEGTNYFWLAYDINSLATASNVVDAECNSIIVGTPRTPTVQAPAGSRTIIMDPCAMPVSSFPYTNDFVGNALPSCWDNIDNDGSGQIWEFDNPAARTFASTTSANGFAILDSDNYGSGSTQDADMISSTFDFTNYTSITLSFEHYFYYWSGSSATVSYSIDGGSTWTEISSWATADEGTGAAPAVFSQDLTAQLEGESNVKFKWNYTGSYGYYWCIDDIVVNATLASTPYTVTFNVTDAIDSHPVDGASVIINSSTLNTDVNGEATIDLVDGTYAYTVGKAGYQEFTGTVTVSGGAVTELVSLSPSTFTITFAVVDESSQPVENASVDINSTTITTDVNGEASIDLINGTYAYTVSKTGYDNATGSATIASAAVTENVTLIETTYTVTFTVTDAADSHALDNASISINSSTLTTDLNGQATIDLVDGTYAYTVTRAGYDEATGSVTVSGAAVSESVTMNETTYTLTFAVVDESSQPVENASVNINSTTITTDVNGEATIDLVNGTYAYTVSKTGFDNATGSVTVASAAATENVTLIETTYAVTFTITDAADSHTLDNASISINSSTLTTDLNGQATIDLPNGVYPYMVTNVGYDNVTGTVTVSDGTVSENVSMYSSSNILTFVVEDESATAIEGASILINSNTLTTDASGEATITLPNGAFNYTVSKSGYADGNGSITMEGADVTENVILYSTASTVTFNVTDGMNPLPGVSIDINSTTIVTEGSGVATINLPDGTYTYTVMLEGYDNATGSVTVSGADITENVTMTESAYSVTFNIQDENAVAVEGATININSNSLTTDAAGQATIELPNGPYSYIVTKAGLADANGSVTVSGAAVSENVIMYSTAHTITFTITNTDGGAAIEGASIGINSSTLLTDASGIATINLPDGTYAYNVVKDGFESNSGSVTLSGADVTENVLLNAIASITFDFNVTDIFCYGATDGVIEFTNVTGGSGSGYEYSVNGGASWQTDPVVTGLSVGTFTAMVKDDAGSISASQAVTITQPDQISGFVVDTENVSTYGGNDGSITISGVTGGSGSYEYSIDGGTTFQTSSLFENLIAGEYNIFVRDSYGCGVDAGTVTITQPAMNEYTVTFQVLVDNQVYEGASILVNNTTLTTNTDGLATIDLPDGSYEYTASVVGFNDITETVVVSGADVIETISFVGINGAFASQINIYPNPVSATLNIDIEGAYTVTLVNSIGNRILTKKMESKGSLEIESYADGLYLLRIEQNGQVITKPVIIKK